MKQEQKKWGGTPCLRTGYRPWGGEESLCESRARVSGALDYPGSPSLNCVARLVGVSAQQGIPNQFGKEVVDNKGTTSHSLPLESRGCVRARLGRGRRVGGPRQPGGTRYSEVALHTCHPICLGLWMVSLWHWVLAVLTSCFLPALLPPPSSQALNHWAG